MIIKDVFGFRYNLSKTKLRAIDTPGIQYTIFFDDLRKHFGQSAQLFSKNECTGELHGEDWWIRVEIDKNFLKIGCKSFSEKVFRQIMKAAGVK